MSPRRRVPAQCRKDQGHKFPRTALFAWLRSRWLAAEDGRTVNALAKLLSERQPRVSSWATNSEGYSPPWWALCRLLHELDMNVEVDPAGIVVRTEDDGLLEPACLIKWDGTVEDVRGR